jgi:MFS family permease
MQSPTTDAALGQEPPRSGLLIGGPFFALAVLFSMNLLNYVDRYSFFAVGAPIMDGLRIGHVRYGVLSSSFMIVYTLVSPVMGWFGDRYHRKGLLAAGVGLWSLATVGTAFSHGFYDMFFWRALLGVGEATYGVIAPSLLSDLFRPAHRGRVMGLYFLALPLGGAVGMYVGGHVAHLWGWRAVFWVVGLPGILAALAGLFIVDPGRGASEGKAHSNRRQPGEPRRPLGRRGASEGKAHSNRGRRPHLSDYVAMLRTPTFFFNTAGLAAVTFATGAYAAWGPAFYQTVRGLTNQQAANWIGVMIALAGLVGIVVGIGLADLLLRFTRRAYLLMAGMAVALAVVPGALAIVDPDRDSSLRIMFVAMLPMAMVLGPCNTVTANVVPASRRSSGFALSIFLIHLFGDIASPILIGAISQFCGRAWVVASPLGRILAALGAKPVGGTNLTAGMLAVIPVMALGAVLFLIGARHLPQDQDRARETTGDEIASDLPFH